MHVAGVKQFILEAAGLPVDAKVEWHTMRDANRNKKVDRPAEERDGSEGFEELLVVNGIHVIQEKCMVEDLGVKEWEKGDTSIRMIVDNKALQEVLCGHSQLKEDQVRSELSEATDVVCKLRGLGWGTPLRSEDPWLSRLGELNKNADEMCKLVFRSSSSFRFILMVMSGASLG